MLSPTTPTLTTYASATSKETGIATTAGAAYCSQSVHY
jgi:hypothetical protein